MNNPILKSHWERFTEHIHLDIPTAARLVKPHTTDHIEHISFLSEGCANTNYKITFKNNNTPVVLRLYTRDHTALQREVDIHQLIAHQIPVAKHLYFDDSCSLYQHPYAILEWINGTLLREIILSHNATAIQNCVFQAGNYLDILRRITFPHGGFFQKNLNVLPFLKEEEYLPFVHTLLRNDSVKYDLGNSLHSAVSQLIDANVSLLPEKDLANLTHADYDPANIMVAEINGTWKITAILDWEFSFAGTYLLDIGTMLRYSHKLPQYYETSFVAGIESHEFILPSTWKKQVKLMDILCLLNLVYNNPSSARPNLKNDVISLMSNTVQNWNLY